MGLGNSYIMPSLWGRNNPRNSASSGFGLIALLAFAPLAATTEQKEAPEPQCVIDRTIDVTEIPALIELFYQLPETPEEFCEAELLLATGPPRDVLDALLPFLNYRYENPRPIFSFDKWEDAYYEMPVPWYAVLAADRIFDQFLDMKYDADSASLARELLRDDRYKLMEPNLIKNMEADWNEESEAIAYSVLNRRPTGRSTVAAASAILRRDVWNGYKPAMEALKESSGIEKRLLCEKIVFWATQNSLALDPELLRIAGAIIREWYYAGGRNVQAAYGLSCTVSTYINFPIDEIDPIHRIQSTINVQIQQSILRVLERIPEVVREVESDAAGVR